MAIDRTSKFAYAELHGQATRRVAADFLRALARMVPYRIHTVLTDNGTQFTDCTPPAKSWPPPMQPRPDGLCRRHAFDWACEQLGIEQRFTKPAHRWTNGQVERMNRTLKATLTVKRYHYDSHEQLRAHLELFLHAYNHARRLKSLRGLTPYEFICKAWVEQPSRFTVDPTHHTLGPNI